MASGGATEAGMALAGSGLVSATSTRGKMVLQPAASSSAAGRDAALQELCAGLHHSCPRRCSIWSLVWMALLFSS